MCYMEQEKAIEISYCCYVFKLFLEKKRVYYTCMKPTDSCCSFISTNKSEKNMVLSMLVFLITNIYNTTQFHSDFHN